MGKSVTFDDLWPHLEPLSQAEIDVIYSAARSDRRYKTSLYGVLLAYVVAITGISFGIPALYRFFHPILAIKLGIVALLLLFIWLGVRLLFRINQGFYDQAIMRQIWARQVANGA